MDKDEIRRLQETQLQILRKVDTICKKRGLTYYMIGGTLLGAIRHNGFIPWDPDIDIAMPRKDYEKLIVYFNHNDLDLFCQCIQTDKWHGYPHIIVKQKGTHIIYKKSKTKHKPKNDGVYIDIFPLDKPPIDTSLQVKHAKKILFIKRLIFAKVGTIYPESSNLTKIMKSAMHILLIPFSFGLLQNALDKEMKRYNHEQSDYLVSMASHYSYKKQLMKKSIYGVPKRLQFEGDMFLAPEKPDEYLKQLFGDYMKLPPVDQRYQALDDIKCVIYDSDEL